MENIINLECNNVKLFLLKKKGAFANFTCTNAGEKLDILVSIENRLNEIYSKIKINEDFLKRLEYKLKYSIKLKPAKLTFLKKDENWFLQTPLKDIYEPVLITPGGITMGDNPLLINGKILKFISANGNYFFHCSINEIDPISNKFVNKVIKIKVSEVNTCYNNEDVKNKFKELVDLKTISKKTYLNILSIYLEDKNIQIEYDEHNGYTLWTTLEELLGV